MIRVQNLTKVYGDFTAVDNISFEVPRGEIFAFLGPNGAGKTTTIKMLTTLLKPTGGKIELDGLDPTVEQHKVRQSFGIVFQDPSLDSELTAYENMELHGVLYHVPRKVRGERVETLLKLFELWDKRDKYVKEFSGGMRRRLEIARGLLHTPKILFLDEPTSVVVWHRWITRRADRCVALRLSDERLGVEPLRGSIRGDGRIFLFQDSNLIRVVRLCKATPRPGRLMITRLAKSSIRKTGQVD